MGHRRISSFKKESSGAEFLFTAALTKGIRLLVIFSAGIIFPHSEAARAGGARDSSRASLNPGYRLEK